MCRHLLPDPGPEVVGELIEEINRLRKLAASVSVATNMYNNAAVCEDVSGKNWFEERDDLLFK